MLPEHLMASMDQFRFQESTPLTGLQGLVSCCLLLRARFKPTPLYRCLCGQARSLSSSRLSRDVPRTVQAVLRPYETAVFNWVGQPSWSRIYPRKEPTEVPKLQLDTVRAMTRDASSGSRKPQAPRTSRWGNLGSLGRAGYSTKASKMSPETFNTETPQNIATCAGELLFMPTIMAYLVKRLTPGELAIMQPLSSDEPVIMQRISLSEVYGCALGQRRGSRSPIPGTRRCASLAHSSA